MKVVRHGKPSKLYTDTLRSPTSDDYERLVSAAVEAVIGGSTDVLVAFAYTLKFPEDFPKGILVEKVEHKNVHRIKAKKLLKWLYDHGHTDITTDTIRGALIADGLAMKQFDEMCDLPVLQVNEE